MDFGRSHCIEDGLVVRSKIRTLPEPKEASASAITACGGSTTDDLDARLIRAANEAARALFGTSTNVAPTDTTEDETTNAVHYPERSIPRTTLIKPNTLVVLYESFDNLNFVYATPGSIFSNRNGHFHHDDFLSQPFGSKIRSRTNQGYGHVYVLRPTPELWARSLNHRTQIVHELDASLICLYLELRPGMVVCESGTGSGSMSHAILRCIAPSGRLHTYEFHKGRCDAAKLEFEKNGVDHLVTVHHRDVCGKTTTTPTTTTEPTGDDGTGGFQLPPQSVDAIFLDLPEPWEAVPHAATTLKPNIGKLGCYSPCLEQTQRTVALLRELKFHSIRVLEARLKEYYVDDVVLEDAPGNKLPKLERTGVTVPPPNTNEAKSKLTVNHSVTDSAQIPATSSVTTTTNKRKLCARPFATMRGHTAFLTFATAPLQL